MAKAKHKDFSTMTDDELQAFCRALNEVARRAEDKMLGRPRRSASPPPQEKHDAG